MGWLTTRREQARSDVQGTLTLPERFYQNHETKLQI